MGGFVSAVRSGLVWPPFDPGAAARYYDFMPYILHLPWKEEVLVDAPKRSVYQLSLWLSCHIPPRCRWSVPGPQYARTSPKWNSRKFAVAISGLRRPKEGHPIATWSGPRRYPGRFATNRARKRSNLLRLATGRLSENFGVWRTSPLRSSKKFALRG